MSEAEPAMARPDFEDFFRAQYPRVVRLAWLLTRSPDAAEDVAQEALAAVHGRLGQLDEPAAYLTRVVVNRCRTWHRKSASSLRLVQPLAQLPQGDMTSADDEYLLDVVHALPYRQPVVVVARYWGGWSEAEIAAALGCRAGTVKSLASRAMSRLRKELER